MKIHQYIIRKPPKVPFHLQTSIGTDIVTNAEIIAQLNTIAAEEHVSVLFACESGSRAWGFPSQDSDYDVRFIYLRDWRWYLSVEVERKRDVIERPISGDLDINGWDLRKALNLLRKSNPTLMEWLDSPIVYQQDETFHRDFIALIDNFFSRPKCFHHYLSMACKNYRGYLQGDMVRIKKYFYVLRPILAARWLEEERGPVPMAFEMLVNTVVKDKALRMDINDLITYKRDGVESEYSEPIPNISQFIETELARLENSQTPQAAHPDADSALLDAFFIATLQRVSPL
jgi:predicted nucleotidyltransferase